MMKFEVITKRQSNGKNRKIIPIEISLSEIDRNKLNDYLIRDEISLQALVRDLILEELQLNANSCWRKLNKRD